MQEQKIAEHESVSVDYVQSEKRKSQEDTQVRDSGFLKNKQAVKKQLTMPLSSQSDDKEPAGTQFDETESVLTPPPDS